VKAMKKFIALFAKNQKESRTDNIGNGYNIESVSSPTYHKIDSKKVKIYSIELNLDIYGSMNNPLFDHSAFSTSLKIPRLDNIITSKFDNNVDYKMNNDIIYLTYAGVLRILFTFSKSNIAMGFKKWYDSVFMESINYTNVVSEVFSKFELSCIYLLYIGDYKGHKNVYKFGRTDNFIRRYKELNKAYNCIFKIYTLQYIDPEYLSRAETEVCKFLSEYIVKIDNHTELFSITDPTSFIQKYKEIGSKYSMTNKEMKEHFNEMLHKNKLLEMELSLANSLKDLANEKLRHYE
jgi:hypothetical protein